MLQSRSFQDLHETGFLLDESCCKIDVESSSDANLDRTDRLKRRCFRVLDSIQRHWCEVTAAITLLVIVITITTASIKRDCPSTARAFPGQTTASLSQNTSIGNVVLRGCGSTAAEAKERGCVFDLMNFGWTPAECYNEQLAQESLQNGPWKFFYDEAATKPIPGNQDTELLSVTETVWSSLEFHVAHCVYTWKQMHQSVTVGRPLPDALLSFHHTSHCSDLILSYKDNGESLSRTDLKFRPCVALM
jgi:hypothetical protein